MFKAIISETCSLAANYTNSIMYVCCYRMIINYTFVHILHNYTFILQIANILDQVILDHFCHLMSCIILDASNIALVTLRSKLDR